MEIIFSHDRCVRENTSQAASVEFVRLWHTNYVRSRLQAFCRKTRRVFRQSRGAEGQIGLQPRVGFTPPSTPLLLQWCWGPRWCRPDHAGCHLRREVGFLSIFAVHFFLHRGTPVRASLFSSPPHPSRFLNGGRCPHRTKSPMDAPHLLYILPYSAVGCRRPRLDRTENFGYNRRYTRFGGVYAVRR